LHVLRAIKFSHSGFTAFNFT